MIFPTLTCWFSVRCTVRTIPLAYLGCLGSLQGAAGPDSPNETVGRHADGRTVTPVNQIVTPAGRQVDLPGLRPQAIALSPNGRLLVTTGRTNALLVLDPVSGAILQGVSMPADSVVEPPKVVSSNILFPDKDDQLSFTGLVFSPDGSRIFVSDVTGSIKVFAVTPEGRVAPSFSIRPPPANAPRRRQEIPTGLVVSKDGRRLYAALNLGNRLGEFDAPTGQILRTFEVGVAPYDVVLVGKKAYVSNWGGRRPQPGDLTGPAGQGTLVRVDPVRHIANEGSVSVIDLSSGRVVTEIQTGLHASALAVSPRGRYVVCANAGSDNLSVIDTHSDRVVETIWAKQSPSDLFGASPNALAFDPKGKTLYVANGTQNAIGVIAFKPGESKLAGLIPVGWFPGALAFDARRQQLCVANIKGVAREKQFDQETKSTGFNSHQYYGSLSLVPLPNPAELSALSSVVWRNYRKERMTAARLPPRPGQPPRPVPERIGEPSVFKHVVYIIKENRTYDQVLGDDPRGNGDPALCIFGQKISPNQHKFVRDFVLLDNTYCSGILSADGHQWSTTAFGTDYLEKSFASWPRSYPDGMGIDENDALAYAPTGFLWDNALAHQKTVRDYGEFANPKVHWADPARRGSPKFLDCWREFLDRKREVIFESVPAVASLNSIMPTRYVGWEMAVPDQYRAQFITNELCAFETNGDLPNLILICLPNDHTSGTSKGSPTPDASVADNDLAFGQIVQALSHSRFWPETAIFGIEDDPQAGWDHVSGYRTTAYCISAYTRRGVVVRTQYNTTSVIRTMEQILGLPPMNQFDATATPMFDCFTNQPDFTPYVAVPNLIPLDQMNPEPKKLADAVLRQDAFASARLNFKKADACPEDVLNRILWHAMKGTRAPYPEWAITSGTRADDDD